jgi:integrase/recombinase XerD
MTNYSTPFKESMQLRGLSQNTQDRYFSQVQRLEKFIGHSPESVSTDKIKAYLMQFITDEKSKSTVRVAYHAIAFFCKYTLGKPDLMMAIPRMKKPKISVTRYLEHKEVQQIISLVDSHKYQVILQLIYSSGLRISEALRLKIKDIDSKKMRIYVRESKNGKDRVTFLSTKLLPELRIYFKRYLPETFLFYGYHKDQPLSAASVQSAFKRAHLASGISKEASVHTLRHSFATHLVNNKIDILTLQKLMGHSSIKTTAIYYHLSAAGLDLFKSPLDIQPE